MRVPSRTVGLQSGITTVRDGTRIFNDQITLNFSGSDFYLSSGGPQGSVVVNLRTAQDVYKGHMPGVIVDNIFIEPDAEHRFTVENATLDCRTGTAVAGVYIINSKNISLPGRAITGM